MLKAAQQVASTHAASPILDSDGHDGRLVGACSGAEAFEWTVAG
jgi:hypothetical protein